MKRENRELLKTLGMASAVIAWSLAASDNRDLRAQLADRGTCVESANAQVTYMTSKVQNLTVLSR